MIAQHRQIDLSTEEQSRFRIGVVSVSIGGDVPDVLDDFNALYEYAREPVDRRAREDAPRIHMEIRSQRRRWFGRRQHTIHGDGEKLWTAKRVCEILPFLEWGINYRLMECLPSFLQLHAATLVRNDTGLIFAANSGSGKSTLTAALLARQGWQYLSDEFALIEPEAFNLHPFPKAICIKSGAFDLMQRLNLPVWKNRHYIKAFKGSVGYIRPKDIRPDILAAPAPVRYVIFPQYIEGARPALRPVPRSHAAFLLAGCAFNRKGFDRQAVPVINNLIRQTKCYRLEIGQLDETCDLLESAINNGT